MRLSNNTRIGNLLNQSVSIASLVYFRVGFGLFMLIEVWLNFRYGLIERYYIEPSFHFTYWGFSWIRPLPPTWIYVLFAYLALLSVFIMLGYYYRISMTLFFLGFSYIFLLSKVRYLNHFYLIILLSLLLIFLPAHHAFSLDARRNPHARSSFVPAWTIWLLRFQLGVVYFYGGIAKLNADWLFRAQPMGMWLAQSTDFPIVGGLFTLPWVPYFFSYAGLLIDLLAVPGLLWRRTRTATFAVLLLFHLTNAQLFSLGIFPWFMIFATALFFTPDFPTQVAAFFSRSAKRQTHPQTRLTVSSPKLSSVAVGILTVYVALQLFIPLRHHLYPGSVGWTEEGHRFSWRMKLRTKTAVGQLWAYDPATEQLSQIQVEAYLTPKQVQRLYTRPDMLLQFSHFLSNELHKQGIKDVEIYAEVKTSLNGRPVQQYVEPVTDLSKQPYSLGHMAWINALQ